jgi:sulfoxide reductase heme-binding subunit YedZ
MSTQLLWFATRGSGIVSMVLFSLVVVLGILTTMRWQSAGWPRFLTAELHRTISLLSVAFIVAHIVTSILDPFAKLGIEAAVIPFASSYRPLWVGLGVLSMDLGIAVLVTSLLKARIGQRAWRLVHWLAYASWPLAILHTIGSGSDNGAAWMFAIDVACIGSVCLALIWRILASRGPNAGALEEIATGAGGMNGVRGATGARRAPGR